MKSAIMEIGEWFTGAAERGARPRAAAAVDTGDVAGGGCKQKAKNGCPL